MAILLALMGALSIHQSERQGIAPDHIASTEFTSVVMSTATMRATPASGIMLVATPVVDDCGDEEGGEPTPCSGPCHGMCACILGHFAAHPATAFQPPLETVNEVALHEGIARGVRRPSTEPSLRPPIG
jgi:hypothetical protein